MLMLTPPGHIRQFLPQARNAKWFRVGCSERFVRTAFINTVGSKVYSMRHAIIGQLMFYSCTDTVPRGHRTRNDTKKKKKEYSRTT
jgi:hypothetical protein